MSQAPRLSYRPEPAEFAWTFGGVAPVRRVRPGTVMELWTEDAFGGVVRSTDDLPSQVCNAPFFNPQTGPFHVEGAEPGDTLALHLVSIEPSRNRAASATIPFFGSLTSTPQAPSLQPALPELVWIYDIDTARRTITYQAGRSDFSVELPLDPMLGTIGVAPSHLEARSSLVPADHGGNLDTPEARAGVTLYFGVNVEGALFSIGDGHCRQGEGETCGVAPEAAMDVVLVVELVKGVPTPWPRLESDTYLMSAGSARPLEDAFRIAHADLVAWLGAEHGLDPLDAYQLVSQIAETPVANVVDPNYTVVAKLDKRYLPQRAVYRGMHEQLRQLARTLA